MHWVRGMGDEICQLVYVLGGIISISGAISAKELVKKRKTLRKAKAEKLIHTS